ncbi:uncharacterized protein [Rutidosis leptorrhynchoides]|uniref:uncharacterized protein isoform X2 n=1 Tax=Rutidosis leptorrhynchoides TaxID=125765 RepID=UPI003A9934E2
MPHKTTHRRNLSTPTSLNHHQHPHPSATIQEISTHFSRLYLNHKACTFSPSTHPPESTAVKLTKSQSQRPSGTENRGYPFNINEQPQEQEESIKKAIVTSSKKPIKNIDGYVNLMSENEELRKLQHGFELKMQSLALDGLNKGRRRSFGSNSKVEMAYFLGFNGVKVVSSDMPPFMQIHAVNVTRKTYDSLEKFTAKTLALTLKKVKIDLGAVCFLRWFCLNICGQCMLRNMA